MANMTDEKARISDEKLRHSLELDQAAHEPAQPVLPTINPDAVAKPPAVPTTTVALCIASWIGISAVVIMFNKWILSRKFEFPIFLTTWHMFFATVLTQIFARTTTFVDQRKDIPMTGRVYLRAILPIGIFFSMSLIFGNVAYLYLSVSFIQMLKATTPVFVLFATWGLGLAKYDVKKLINVTAIVVGVVIASIGEIKFVMIGFLVQIVGICCEAVRLTMVQSLLNGSEFKMKPMVSMYYYAPACCAINFVVFLIVEFPKMTLDDIARIGMWTLVANAACAFCLNLAVVLLVKASSGLVLTLSGVLKDIILVCASMLIFGDPVAPLQMFGYSIALAGLTYYKLGPENSKLAISQASIKWQELGQKRPISRKLLVFAIVAVGLFIVLGGVAPRVAPEQTKAIYDGIGSYVPNLEKAT